VQQAPGEARARPPLVEAAAFANARESFLRVDRRYVRFFAGLALISALLVPVSLVTSNGIASYREFYKNSPEAQQDAAHELHGPQRRS